MTLDLAIPKKYRDSLRLGTCSWKYDSWKGLVYEPGKRYRPGDYLADYARVFGSVEVDQWFWSLFAGGVRLPDPKDVRLYAQSVPDDFVFTVKAPNALTLTHFYARGSGGQAALAGEPNPHFLDRDLMRRFRDALAPMGRKLGPVMFQFEYLNKKKMPSPEAFIERFGEFIDRAPGGIAYAVEIRNPNYLAPGFFEFLAGRVLGFVYLEGYYMPSIGGVFERFRPATAPFQLIRLHGGDRLAIEGRTGEVWDAVVAPKPGAIAAAVRIVKANAARKVLTYLNLNNHFEGSAPLSARRFLDALEA